MFPSMKFCCWFFLLATSVLLSGARASILVFVGGGGEANVWELRREGEDETGGNIRVETCSFLWDRFLSLVLQQFPPDFPSRSVRPIGLIPLLPLLRRRSSSHSQCHQIYPRSSDTTLSPLFSDSYISLHFGVCFMVVITTIVITPLPPPPSSSSCSGTSHLSRRMQSCSRRGGQGQPRSLPKEEKNKKNKKLVSFPPPSNQLKRRNVHIPSSSSSEIQREFFSRFMNFWVTKCLITSWGDSWVQELSGGLECGGGSTGEALIQIIMPFGPHCW